MNMISRYLKQGYNMLERQLKTIKQEFQVETYKEEGKIPIQYLKFYQQSRNLVKWLNDLLLHLSPSTLIITK